MGSTNSLLPQVWAASVIHVIARMNFLFDRNEPIHLTLDMIADFFGVKEPSAQRPRTSNARCACDNSRSRDPAGADFSGNVRMHPPVERNCAPVENGKWGVVPDDAKVEDFL